MVKAVTNATEAMAKDLVVTKALVMVMAAKAVAAAVAAAV
jgi:hypothetical protein